MMQPQKTDTNEHCNGEAGTNESGQATPLIIGLIAVALLAVTVMLAATQINGQARRLLGVADGASTAAADDYLVQLSGGDLSLKLTDATVRESAANYLSQTRAGTYFSGLSIQEASASPDGRTAHLKLSARVHPPLVNWIVPEGVTVSVESDARVHLEQ